MYGPPGRVLSPGVLELAMLRLHPRTSTRPYSTHVHIHEYIHTYVHLRQYNHQIPAWGFLLGGEGGMVVGWLCVCASLSAPPGI